MNIPLLLTRLNKLNQAFRSTRLLKALILRRVLVCADHRPILSPELAFIVDIGANRGQFALAARRWAPECRIVSFEPLKQPSGIFNDIFKDDHRVTLHQSAIGPLVGETIIHVSAADDASSLLPISSRQERLFPGTGQIGIEKIKIGRLSDFIAAEEIVPPAMLKLDVQGYELPSLQGCEELLDRFLTIYVECSFVELYTGQALADEIIAWLKKRGFRLKGIYNPVYDRDGNSIQADFLFENAEIDPFDDLNA